MTISTDVPGQLGQLLGKNFVILGTGPVAVRLSRMCRPEAFLDDSLPGQWLDGIPVFDLDSAPVSSVVLNASTLRNNFAQARLHRRGLRALSVFSLLAAVPQAAEIIMPALIDWRSHIERAEDQYRQWQEVLADEESRVLLDRLVAFWKTWDVANLDIYSFAPEQQYTDLAATPPPTALLDVGAYTGDSTRHLLRSFPSINAVTCFEADPANFLELCDSWARDPRVDLVLGAVSDSPNPLRMALTGRTTSREDQGSKVAISTVALDPFVRDRAFIKIDIEGGELGALRSCADAIRARRPTLAIACYHYPGQMLDVLQLVWGIRDDYQVFIRHYTEGLDETVLYFI